ncbi:SRPBCC domain-containing protein [Streptomyces sp. NPDC012693]|jgi:carbon monoxide dehydrogenase subunit G|uniref:SRPBCC domain-containing protein n=1 Tax=unclassified Streptomyces TaxID=2593676 RepID=UPI0020302033|nr:SRPBCC domain-containing protein [Streptomyces sp. MSC1_001]
MEHEVFVPVPAEVLRATLTDPGRVVRCVPGFQRDADAEAGPLTGRLKVRVGGHTITYRGALRIVDRDGALTFEGEGAEVRGKGAAELTLTVVLTPVAEGTSLGFTGAVEASGRLAEATDEERTTAATRLLDRFAEALTGVTEEPEGTPEQGPEQEQAGAVSGAEPAAVSVPEADASPVPEADVASAPEADTSPVPEADAAPEPNTDDDGVDDGVEEPRRGDAPVPPSSTLDPLLGEDFGDASLAFPAPQPAAEAAHARRTMIGRSAEEVDHAPPRGRYAPVPAPESSAAGATLRWIAPAAALALASAVVVSRALRRRR